MTFQEAVADRKGLLRKTAFAQRKAARAAGGDAVACRRLVDHITALRPGGIVSAYMAIQTEIDPMDAMNALHDRGYQIALPVIQGRGKPLVFRCWTPGAAMIEGDFGALIPRGGDIVVPDILVTPLVGFDSAGRRLGYGGGFFDRSLLEIRAQKPAHAVGFAYDGQELPEVAADDFDQPLDALVTQCGTRVFAR